MAAVPFATLGCDPGLRSTMATCGGGPKYAGCFAIFTFTAWKAYPNRWQSDSRDNGRIIVAAVMVSCWVTVPMRCALRLPQFSITTVLNTEARLSYRTTHLSPRRLLRWTAGLEWFSLTSTPQRCFWTRLEFEEAIIPGKTRAILPVHLFGQPANMTALRAIAIKHNLKIVEDAAQAHGAVWEAGPVGSLGDAAGFSFQSSKNLASGEGGALTTNDERVFDLAYSMQNAGRSRIKAERWEHVTLGWNCRITEYQAGLLMTRLGYFDSQQTTRRNNFQYLRDLINNAVSCLKPLALHPGVKTHGMYMFALRYVDAHCGGLTIDNFLELVQAEGVPIYRSFTLTLSEQPAIRNLNKKRPAYFRRLPTPVADDAIHSIAYIPQEVFLGSTNDMDDIIAAIRKVEQYCVTKRVSVPDTTRFNVSHLEPQA